MQSGLYNIERRDYGSRWPRKCDNRYRDVTYLRVPESLLGSRAPVVLCLLPWCRPVRMELDVFYGLRESAGTSDA